MKREIIIALLPLLPALMFLGFIVYRLLWDRRFGSLRNKQDDPLENLLKSNDIQKYQKKSGITEKDLREACLTVHGLSDEEVEKAYKSPERKFLSGDLKNEEELISSLITKEYFERRSNGIYDEKVDPFSKEKETEFLHKLLEKKEESTDSPSLSSPSKHT